ncbi:CCDC90 family protein [Massilia agilis]|uniref:CCDC90 family protein n=1 Tax=Massilia agilis TaxID=1811226 RepID=A0ABT2DA76_9BURK|nr:CCDC90 family protein [Massilia agilis]MCS0808201.1 CCDC90 family protein [Massilia agilis]
MTEMLLDTQKMVEQLEAAGVSHAQARAYVSVLLDAISSADAHYASRHAGKDELVKGLGDLRTEMRQLETRMETGFAQIRAEMANLRTEVIKWVVTVGILQTALITALIVKLVP